MSTVLTLLGKDPNVRKLFKNIFVKNQKGSSSRSPVIPQVQENPVAQGVSTDKGFPTAYCWKHCDSIAHFLLSRLLIQPEEDADIFHLQHSTDCSTNQQKPTKAFKNMRPYPHASSLSFTWHTSFVQYLLDSHLNVRIIKSSIWNFNWCCLLTFLTSSWTWTTSRWLEGKTEYNPLSDSQLPEETTDLIKWQPSNQIKHVFQFETNTVKTLYKKQSAYETQWPAAASRRMPSGKEFRWHQGASQQRLF